MLKYKKKLLVTLMGLSLLLGCRSMANEAPEEQEKPDNLLVQDKYVTIYKSDDTYKVGEAGEVLLTFVPVEGMKINREYPWKLEINQAPDELGLRSKKLKKDELKITSDVEAIFPVAFVPTAPGEHEVKATVKLSVCDDKSCKMPKLELTFVILVE